MRPFRYERAPSVATALRLGLHEGASYVGGGTNILDLMKIDVEHPRELIDINHLPLDRIDEDARGGLRIGALARMSDVAANAVVRSRFPAIAQALDASVSPQLRNMATMGGNLLQRTRCPYFRDVATPCNKRVPGSGCGALQGQNRMQAVLGTSEQCIAAHPSDVAVALTAFDTIVHVSHGAGARDIPLTAFYREPGATPNVENVLHRGELITGMTVPASTFAARSVYLKVRDRAEYEFALASAAVALDVSGGRLRAARVALGGVGTIPWRSLEAERTLEGAEPGRDAFAHAADVALAGARGHGLNDYKIPLAKRTLIRALEMSLA